MVISLGSSAGRFLVLILYVQACINGQQLAKTPISVLVAQTLPFLNIQGRKDQIPPALVSKL